MDDSTGSAALMPHQTLSRTTWIAVPLVFASGFCALIYQIVWTREFRLVFGASTAASAAVVAIFIAGLGLGGLVLGRRVERSARPLAFYAYLELAIAALSALSPWLLQAARAVYVASGGTMTLGVAGASAVRLLLATLVIGAPTFLMGGTLPAIARAVETDEDQGRRGVALVYGVNTLGAVLGCLLATFALLEIFGARLSLWIACLLNALVAVVARAVSRRLGPLPVAGDPEPVPDAAPDQRTPVPRWLVLASAAVVGFAFFLMELVWYRLLGPLLGGTIFTFGLILAVALAGIGIGSALYTAQLSSRRALLSGFALTCLLEAGFILLPYALGDRVALWALLLRPLGELSFAALMFGWALIAGLTVFPAALIAGLQFPMLIALLGSGRKHVGRDVGLAYAANTLGAIAGALAGGFGLMAWLGAIESWRLVSLTLCAWGVVAAVVAIRSEGLRAPVVWAAVALAATLLMLRADGPSAAWRHSPIGAGRVQASSIDSPNAAEAFLAQYRRAIVWQAEGVESAVALDRSGGLAFIINGKSDGNARADAATQVMSGLLGAALQPRIKAAMVIGLGTGSTAGWLGTLPGIERVDVAEIEPAILEVAARCAPVTENALRNPKLRVFRGDARELLAVSRARYDVIFSEPSNPYRAGIASLYTREFYEAIDRRLADGGVFVQWMQAYETDARTMQSIYATLNSVFPFVETWNGMPRDLLLIASRRRPAYDAGTLRARLASQPFARAMQVAWRTEGLEGFLGHYVANAAFARAARRGHEDVLNTDDLAPVEFGLGRALGGDPGFAAETLFQAARDRGENRAPVAGGAVDWGRVDFERAVFTLTTGLRPSTTHLLPEYQQRFEVLVKWANDELPAALALFRRLDPNATTELIEVERLAVAEMLAHAGDPEAEPHIAELAHRQPTEASALRAVWLLHQQRQAEATAAFEDALRRYRRDPWPNPDTMARAIHVLRSAAEQREQAARLLALLAQPFAVHVNEAVRERSRFRLALALGAEDPACLRVFAELEPHVPWTQAMLEFRLACYAAHRSPRSAQAEADLQRFVEHSPIPFQALIR